jgi:hypothetical protein
LAFFSVSRQHAGNLTSALLSTLQEPQLNLTVNVSRSNMAASEEHSQAIGGVLQALVTNASNLTPEAINQITQHILAANVPRTTIPVVTNAQLGSFDGNPGGISRRRSREISARKKADRMRKDRVKLRPLNAFIGFRCKSSKGFVSGQELMMTSLLQPNLRRLNSEGQVRTHPPVVEEGQLEALLGYGGQGVFRHSRCSSPKGQS